jgi:hypothetical protein
MTCPPKPIPVEWIDYTGDGRQPVADDVVVSLWFRDDPISGPIRAGDAKWYLDIEAYRVVPEWELRVNREGGAE